MQAGRYPHGFIIRGKMTTFARPKTGLRSV